MERHAAVWKIHRLLKEGMKGGGNPSREFICLDAIKSAWSDKSTVAGASELLNTFDPTSFPFTDSDLPLPEWKLNTLTRVGPGIPYRFWVEQFRFIPLVISDFLQYVDARIPLPFESVEETGGTGGYSEVYRVGISPGYLKLGSGSVWTEVRDVACKAIKRREHFDTEVENLEVLKMASMRHTNIMLPYAAIWHGIEGYILLPFAELGDLEVFLHHGLNCEGEKIYDFEKRFIAPAGRELISALFYQLFLLAEALALLHNGISTGLPAVSVYFTHMDLKPDNILIMQDKTSSVGRWMLSDFGISAFKEGRPGHVSVGARPGNYPSRATINTRPRRPEGTYQAPEVRLLGSGSSLDESKVGRKSDIWSMGCIFCVLLAFALGGSKLVQEFEEARKEDKDDYFYDTLPTKEYQVRKSVATWLNDLPKHHDNKARWLDCCVATIQRLLDVSAETRPDADDLKKMVKHICEHFAASGTGTLITCSILGAEPTRTDQQPARGRGRARLGSFHGFFSANKRADTPGEGVRSPKSDRRSTVIGGTFIPDPNPNPKNVIGVALAPGASTAAFLENTPTGFYVHVFNVEFGEGSHWLLTRRSLITIPYEKYCMWKSLAIADLYLAAWGHSSARGKKQVALRHLQEPTKPLAHPLLENIATLTEIALSRTGRLAFICPDKILYTSMSSWSTDGNKPKDTLKPGKGQNFSHAAFNDAGDLLYAWAYGNDFDYLYTWRVQEDVDGLAHVKPELVKKGRFRSVPGVGNPEAYILPYPSSQGCIIRATHNSFFPSQDTMIKDPLRRNDITISNVLVSCVSPNNSLITVEESPLWSRPKLKEYPVIFEESEYRLGAGVLIFELGRQKIKVPVAMRGVQSGSDSLVVICESDCNVRVLKIRSNNSSIINIPKKETMVRSIDDFSISPATLPSLNQPTNEIQGPGVVQGCGKSDEIEVAGGIQDFDCCEIQDSDESRLRPAFSEELLPDQAEALYSDPSSWKYLLKLLPKYLRPCLNYNAGAAGYCCWTCTPQFLDANEKIPLFIAGVPVVIPVGHTWPVSASVAPPRDPYPVPLDPTAPIQFNVVVEILNTFEECLGFYLLINGYLQLLVPDSFDKSWAQSHLPNVFGGLQVSYISMHNLISTAERKPAEDGPATAKMSFRRRHRNMSSLFQSLQSSPEGLEYTPPSSVSEPSSVTSPTSTLTLNSLVEARKRVLLWTRRESYAGRIGLRTRMGSSTYLVMPTHVITNAMGWKKGRPNSTPESWENSTSSIDIVSGGIRLGKVGKSFDSDVNEFPVSFNHDVTLIEPFPTVNVDEILSPIHNLDWSSRSAWDKARSRPTIIKYLGTDPRDGESLRTERKGLIIGEGMFRVQRSCPLPRRLELSQSEEHELRQWQNVVSRCILYRVSGDINPRTDYSGTALYMEDCILEFEGHGPGVIGFQSFAHGSGCITNSEFLSEESMDNWLQYGMVSFYGAFQVPDEMRKEHKIINAPRDIPESPSLLEIAL